ncbi:hypothetical protein OAV66_00370 [Planktomarina temperata]|nr:hypothetical protein [Planktomarina temperata]
MQKTRLNSWAKVSQRLFGKRIKSIIRKIGTAIITPITMSVSTGHFRSSVTEKAVDYYGNPLPWLTYPAIDFLSTRDFSDSIVLEFGGGQSTIYWSNRAEKVVTFEQDKNWINYIKNGVKPNTSIYNAPKTLTEQIEFVSEVLSNLDQMYDLIIIDDMHRGKMFDLATQYLKKTGIIICDNAESYDFQKFWRKHPNLFRVDFYGHAPGVLHPHLTTMHFSEASKFLRHDIDIYPRAYGLKKMPSANFDNN